MRTVFVCLILLVFALVTPSTALLQSEAPVTPRRPVHTFSIVARDPATGELGVAVQSHWFSVGSVVPWAEPAVGAVATQSMADPSYGPNALDLLRSGVGPRDALDQLTRSDVGQAVRQVSIVDARGDVAVHTG